MKICQKIEAQCPFCEHKQEVRVNPDETETIYANCNHCNKIFSIGDFNKTNKSKKFKKQLRDERKSKRNTID